MKFLSKFPIVLALPIAALLFVAGPATKVFAATSPTLSAAGSYSVLGHTTVTNTGATTMPGDIGISIGGSPTGFPPGLVGPPGNIRNAGDSLAAQNANTAAYLALSAAPNVACSGQDYGAVTKELEGLTLIPGVYCANAFQLSGMLTLDAQGDPGAVWIFRAELSTLITSTGETDDPTVQFLNGIGSPCNVWWKVASSASLGTNTTFIGNILALTSISMDTGAILAGRALAQTGAVTLDNNTFTGSSCLSPSTSTVNTASTVSTENVTTATTLPRTGTGPEKVNDFGLTLVLGLVIAGSFTLLVSQAKKYQ